MFSIHCARHGHVVLLGPTDILSLAPAAGGGFVLGYRCTCGYEGLWPPEAGEEEWPERMAG